MSENPKTRSFSYLGIAVCIITLLTVLRFWYAQTIELVGDEAYYWQWSKHLDWSYYSKGPGVALTIMGGTWFFGDTVLGVRFFAVLLSAGTALGIYTLGRLLFSDKVGFFALLFVMSIPLFALGGVLMTIDPLSVFFWVWSCVAFWMALQSRRLLWWVLAGLLIGAGMLAKYTNVVLLISFLVFLVFSSRDRKVLNFVNYLLMTTITVLCMAPVYIWNKINEWITIEHLLHRGGLDSSFTVNVFEAFYFLLMQAVGVSPFIWLLMLTGGLCALRPKLIKENNAWLFLAVLFFPLILFYSFLSLKEAGEVNWTAPSFVAGSVLAAALTIKWMESKSAMRWLAYAALGLGFFMTLMLHDLGYKTIKPIEKLHNRARGVANLADQVEELQQKHGASFIISNKYSWASLLAFYLQDQPRVYLPSHEGIVNQYSFWSGYDDGFWRESALLVSDSEDVPVQLTREFGDVELLEETFSVHKGKHVRKFYIFLCDEFGGQEEELSEEQIPQDMDELKDEEGNKDDGIDNNTIL